MRSKLRAPGRPPPRRPARRKGQPTADWLLENEVGWGLPHGIVALLAALVVAARGIGWQVRRVAAWAARRGRRAAP
jgi:uncharacterized membrane protein SpoIIM required for sporulation